MELEIGDPPDTAHYVQLYELDDCALVDNVARYLHDGLTVGGSALVIASAERGRRFGQALVALDRSMIRMQREERIVYLDAEATLARIMVDGYPDASRFEREIGTAVRAATARSSGQGVWAYGEMVGVLWGSRQYPAAIRLEQLWNRLRNTVPFNLFCGYPIGVFDRQFDVGVIDALLCAHTHLLPPGNSAELERAVSRAVNELLGLDPDVLRASIATSRNPLWPSLSFGEELLLWVRQTHPDDAEGVVSLAQRYHEAAG